MNDTPLDVLASELAGIADDAERRTSLIVAEAKQKLAEVEARFLEKRFALAEFEAQASARIEARLAAVKDGQQGERGPAGGSIKGDQGEAGTDGLPGERGTDGAPGLHGERGENGERGTDGLPGERGEPGLHGEKGDPGLPGERGADGLAGQKGDHGDAGPQGENGEKGETGDRGEPGADGNPGERGADGLHGEAGKSVTLDELAPVIVAEVSKQVSAIPLPKDAPPVTPEALKAAVLEHPDAIAAAVAKYLKDNPPPAGKDGIGVTGGIIDREGNLIFTTSNGVAQALGRVVGKDAESVSVNMPELDDEVCKSVASALRLLAERPEMAKEVQSSHYSHDLLATIRAMPQASSPVVNVHVPEIKIPDVNVHMAEQKAPIVNYTPPAINIPAPVVNVSGDRIGKKTRNTVSKHFKDGRIQEFDQEVIG